MIELQNLSGLNKEAIIDLLLEEKAQPFEIYIPKSTQQFFSETFAIADDYFYLAYAGQLLKDVSDTFEYDVVLPEYHESILFTIRCKDITALAETLLLISYYDINDNKEDEEFIFWELLEEFKEKLEKNLIVPACPHFIEISKQFQEEAEAEKGDD